MFGFSLFTAGHPVSTNKAKYKTHNSLLWVFYRSCEYAPQTQIINTKFIIIINYLKIYTRIPSAPLGPCIYSVGATLSKVILKNNIETNHILNYQNDNNINIRQGCFHIYSQISFFISPQYTATPKIYIYITNNIYRIIYN